MWSLLQARPAAGVAPPLNRSALSQTPCLLLLRRKGSPSVRARCRRHRRAKGARQPARDLPPPRQRIGTVLGPRMWWWPCNTHQWATAPTGQRSGGRCGIGAAGLVPLSPMSRQPSFASPAPNPPLSTRVTDLWAARLGLCDQLRWVVTVYSTLLSDNLGLKHSNIEFVILRSPRHVCSRTTVCSPSSCSLPPLNRVPDSPSNPSSQHLQNLKYRT